MKTNLRERLTRYRCFIRPKVHFAPEFSFWYVLAYLKGSKDVDVFVSTVFEIFIFLGQTVLYF